MAYVFWWLGAFWSFYDKTSILYVEEEDLLPHDVVPVTGDMCIFCNGDDDASDGDSTGYNVSGHSQLQ